MEVNFMNTLILQFKSIVRNKFFSALSVIMLSVYTLYLAWQIYFAFTVQGQERPLELFLCFSLTVPFLTIFFMFFSYESFTRIKKYDETVCTSKKNIMHLYLNNFIIMLIFALVIFAQSVIFVLIENIKCEYTSAEMVLDMLAFLFIYVFLALFAATSIGLCLSQLKHRVISYLAMLLFVFGSLFDLAASVSCIIYNEKLIDLTKLLKLFCISTYAPTFVPNEYTGAVPSFNITCQILLFIFLSLGIFFLIRAFRQKSNKKTVPIVICFALSVFCLFGYFTNESFLTYSNCASGQFKDAFYYQSHLPEVQQSEENAAFEVEDCKIEITAILQMNAKAKLKLKQNNLKEYKFTLSHDYQIKKITDSTGKALPFERRSDYVTVKSENSLNEIDFEYYGGGNRFYSNARAIFLPSYYTFYPIAGFLRVHDGSNSFLKISYPYDVNFDITFNCSKEVFSNIDAKEKNHFVFKGSDFIFLSGKTATIKVENTQIIYSYFDASTSDEVQKSAITGYIQENPQIKKILVQPSLNLIDTSIIEYDDYVICQSMRSFEASLLKTRIVPEREFLYNLAECRSEEVLDEAIGWIEQKIKWYESGNITEPVSDDEIYIAQNAEEIKKLFLTDRDETFRKAVFDYAMDSSDKRTVIQFIESQR